MLTVKATGRFRIIQHLEMVACIHYDIKNIKRCYNLFEELTPVFYWRLYVF